MSPRKLRVLGLHGWRTSGSFLQWQTEKYSGLTIHLSDLIEITYLDAPNAATGPIPYGVEGISKGPFYEWWSSTERGEYVGMDESLDHLLGFMRDHGPFDGLLGFSQGGTMAAIIAASCQAGRVELDSPPRFCLIIAGFLSRDVRFAEMYNEPIRMPAVIVHGRRDPGALYTKQLATKFVEPTEVSHSGGHVVPALGQQELEQVRSFLRKFR